jgi:MinD superfamily P-loop ATPase
VLGGKGGTGKTSLVAALAALAQDKVRCDADVDTAELHLLLEPRFLERHDFFAGH